MRLITNEELAVVGGGDRWGDGHDEYNHPAPDSAADAEERLQALIDFLSY